MHRTSEFNNVKFKETIEILDLLTEYTKRACLDSVRTSVAGHRCNFCANLRNLLRWFYLRRLAKRVSKAGSNQVPVDRLRQTSEAG